MLYVMTGKQLIWVLIFKKVSNRFNTTCHKAIARLTTLGCLK
ncbi:MAG: hypothetical protein ACJA13_003347 [Paraglaciecola sp.]|jgi:hypothetical protein